MSLNKETCKAAWIANLKTQSTLTALVGSEIREVDYQATDWTYPAVRVDLRFIPSVNGCGLDDAYVTIICYTDEKSSKESEHIASLIEDLYHKRPFSQNGFMFPVVVVQEVSPAIRSIFSWETTVTIHCMGN